MKRRSFGFALIAVVVAAVVLFSLEGGGVPRAVMRAKDGVVRIFSYDGDEIVSGSGFAVANTNRGAYIVTNYHVVNDFKRYELYYDGMGPFKLSVLASSESQDLCVLTTDVRIKHLSPLVLCTGKIQSGQAVYALGYPGGADLLTDQTTLTKDEMTITNGIVSAIQSSYMVGDTRRPIKLLQTNADINHGNSGGPMLNGKGQVVGINTLGLSDLNITGMNGAVHVEELRDFLDTWKIPYQTFGRRLLVTAGAAAVVLMMTFLSAALYRRKKRKTPVEKMPLPGEKEEAAPPFAEDSNAIPFPGNSSLQVELLPLAQASGEEEEPKPSRIKLWGKKEAEQPQKPQKKKRRKIFWIAGSAAVAVVLLGGGFAWYSYDVYTSIEEAVGYKNYTKVLQLYEEAPWLKEYGDAPQMQTYCTAMLAVENYQLLDAIQLFRDLGDYRDSQKQFELIVKYRDAGNGTILDRYKKYSALGDFLNSKSLAEKAQQELYDQAKYCLISGSCTTAEYYFQQIPSDYEETAKYLKWAEFCSDLMDTEDPEQLMAGAEMLGGATDLQGVDLTHYIEDDFPAPFLNGNWYHNGWYFKYDYINREYETNIGFSGSYYFGDEGFWKNDTKVVGVEYVSLDCIKMTYRGYTYTLFYAD